MLTDNNDKKLSNCHPKPAYSCRSLKAKQSPGGFFICSDEVRLLREAKKLTHREICEMFDWVQSDVFWKSNILSPAKLREKWDQLTIKRGTPQKGPKHDNFSAQDYRAGVRPDGSF